MKQLLSLHPLRLTSKHNKMIIETPEDFFKKPEKITAINIVDIVNRFTSMIEEYLADFEPAIITNDGLTVIAKKSDVILNSDREVIKFEDFLNYTGYATINDGHEHKLNRAKSHKIFRYRTQNTVVTQILLAFIRDDISRRSNWEAVYEITDVIAEYISDKFDIQEVYDYINQRIDPVLMNISEYYHGLDWNIHEVVYDGYRLTLTSYGDWRAYIWNKERYDLQLEAEHSD